MTEAEREQTRKQCKKWLEDSHSQLSDLALERARDLQDLRDLIKRLYG